MTLPRTLLLLASLAAPLLLHQGLAAQDTNTLGRHLEHQQSQRVQDHQNDMRQTPARSRAQCSADALPAADRREMEAEYVRRVGADGKASADAWVREQGRRFRLQLIAAGVCSDPATASDEGEPAAAEDEGCRMVMRPVAGLGGAPMTMGMVPECD